MDDIGGAYVTGLTNSNAATFPVLVGPDLTYNGGAADAFVAKVRPTGTLLEYAGYIGGERNDEGHDVAVDPSGAAYVTGETLSTEASFPVPVGPDLTYNGGFSDAFVAKVDAAGTALVSAGYIGGLREDSGTGIVVNDAGQAYVVGFTESGQATFPDGNGFGALGRPRQDLQRRRRRLCGESQRGGYNAPLRHLHRWPRVRRGLRYRHRR